ncbi:MAG: hypothetical protein WCK82_01180 [Bacteroidota bacterium]
MNAEPRELLCSKCKHFRPFQGGCDAFPDGIPYEISSGIQETHDVPTPDQENDIVFEEGEPVTF